jgi:pimeloyl-ACP methyl ester carboxylesterase
LVIEATKGVTDIVEGVHTAVGAFPIITNAVYSAVRGVTGVVGVGVDALVCALAPLLGESALGPQREAALAALNGVIGDRLEETNSPLAINMSLRPPLAGLHRGGTLLVLIHGSSMHDLQWSHGGHDYGRALACDLGLTPIYVHYNSGRHVSTNGDELSKMLEAASEPFARIVLLAHSMGGLVARSAIHAAEIRAHAWRGKLSALVTLGTPHHGSGIERGGHVIHRLLALTQYSAPLAALGNIRSAGITDLRYGNVVEADWKARDRFSSGLDPRTPTPLPAGVRCYVYVATPSARPPRFATPKPSSTIGSLVTASFPSRARSENTRTKSARCASMERTSLTA